ncbi:nitric oxide synthase oxygenase [Kitasatospora acidiphila]|uniref:Nitric oxide synthase oxygenase n=1 Tax=Kitasatospora acidiphila TaxID=2567942 RepID=A0A540W1E8_9ACTN|nr:nitric oxide synthase oxygenase [Kitasatospora acidiphila]TQF02845.1 nitric oxide synthase oxygenase [Kitasatospora acidiphila]
MKTSHLCAAPSVSSVQSIGPVVAEAADLVRQLSAEGLLSAEAAERRVGEIARELAATGTYRQSEQELLAGTRIAWRNNPQCIGKFYWKGLEVRDCREIDAGGGAESALFEMLVEHLRLAWNGGKVRLLLTAFTPAEPGRPGPRVWNGQLIRYAGYRRHDGSVLGDPETVELTEAVLRMGWRGQGTEYDVLPLVVQWPERDPKWFELPPDAVPEVRISHPEYPWFEDLGLRWHAFPTISNQVLDLGGLRYTLAPFSAWYTCTEIGARNLSDTNRYDKLPEVARGMGLDTSRDRTLWRDRALLELTAAVLHSYDQAGVSIIDHHFATKQFVRHEERELKHGRRCPADWSAIVPATSGSTTPVWQRRYEPTKALPNFSPHQVPWAAGSSAPGAVVDQ